MDLSRLKPCSEALDREMREVFSTRQGFLYDVLRYHLGWTDRQGAPEDNQRPPRFPSMLAMVSCEALSGDYHASLPAAAGVELVYNFTLVHGDVQSGRPDPQDRPTIWWVWGPAQAINAGDGLHALGRIAFMRLGLQGVPPERVLRAVESLDRACLSLCEGQFMDQGFQDQLMVTSADYFDMIGRKTGALAGCSAEAGALAAGAGDAVCARFRDLGRLLGMAWQISLDIADLWGRRPDGGASSNVLGKKKGLPLVHALENASVTAKRELGAIYMKRVLQPEDASRLADILEKAGSRRFAEQKAKELVEQAVGSLDGVALGPEGMEDLRHLARWALEGAGMDLQVL